MVHQASRVYRASLGVGKIQEKPGWVAPEESQGSLEKVRGSAVERVGPELIASARVSDRRDASLAFTGTWRALGPVTLSALHTFSLGTCSRLARSCVRPRL